MPSKSRNTVRRNFSINQEASQAIDSFAAEHNLTKSKVVERAVLEHTKEDRAARIETKVDEILATLEGGSDSLAQTGGKKKNSQSSTDFDPAGYNPDEDRDEPLSKAELKELVKTDEPVINPEHIDENNIPGSVAEKTTLIAAVVRHKDRQYFHDGTIVSAIEDLLGTSEHLRDQYSSSVTAEFESRWSVEFNQEERKYECDRSGYFTTESHQQEYYQERYETIQEAVDTPIDEMPEFVFRQRPYEFLRQWLDEYQISNSIQELDIATSDEIDELKEELADYRDGIDQCLTAIDDTMGYSKDFSREEAIEAVPYDGEQAESVVTLLDELDYIGDWEQSTKDMGLDETRIVWW